MQDKKNEDINKGKTDTPANHSNYQCEETGFTAWQPRRGEKTLDPSHYDIHGNHPTATFSNLLPSTNDSFFNNSLQRLHECKSPISEIRDTSYLSPLNCNFKTLPIRIIGKSRSKNICNNYPNNFDHVNTKNQSMKITNSDNNDYNMNNDFYEFEACEPLHGNAEEVKNISSVSFSVASGHVLPYKHSYLPTQQALPQLPNDYSSQRLNYSSTNIVPKSDCANPCCKLTQRLTNSCSIKNRNVKINNNPIYCDNSSDSNVNRISNKGIPKRPDAEIVNLHCDLASNKMHLPLKTTANDLVQDKNNNVNLTDNYRYFNKNKLQPTSKIKYVHNPKPTTTTLF